MSYPAATNGERARVCLRIRPALTEEEGQDNNALQCDRSSRLVWALQEQEDCFKSDLGAREQLEKVLKEGLKDAESKVKEVTEVLKKQQEQMVGKERLHAEAQEKAGRANAELQQQLEAAKAQVVEAAKAAKAAPAAAAARRWPSEGAQEAGGRLLRPTARRGRRVCTRPPPPRRSRAAVETPETAPAAAPR